MLYHTFPIVLPWLIRCVEQCPYITLINFHFQYFTSLFKPQVVCTYIQTNFIIHCTSWYCLSFTLLKINIHKDMKKVGTSVICWFSSNTFIHQHITHHICVIVSLWQWEDRLLQCFRPFAEHQWCAIICNCIVLLVCKKHFLQHFPQWFLIICLLFPATHLKLIPSKFFTPVATFWNASTPTWIHLFSMKRFLNLLRCEVSEEHIIKGTEDSLAICWHYVARLNHTYGINITSSAYLFD